nr:isoaspartyl peptidase/L-asparaginase [Rhodothermus marinus]
MQRDYIGRAGFVRYWDEEARAPYLWHAAERIFISYEDTQSLAEKVAYVRAHRLGGSDVLGIQRGCGRGAAVPCSLDKSVIAMKRRELIQLGVVSGLLGLLGIRCLPAARHRLPVAVATWDHGQTAVETAWRVLQQGGSLLDAVEEGIRVVEADPTVRTVGVGGYPDVTGRVTLDASIMEGIGRCGAVAFLELRASDFGGSPRDGKDPACLSGR